MRKFLLKHIGVLAPVTLPALTDILALIPAGSIIRSEQLDSQGVVWHYWAGQVFHPPGRTGAKEVTHFRGVQL